MFDWMLSKTHAIAILKKDHDDVKRLFDEFEKAKTTPAREKIIPQAVAALRIHAVLEEEIFYPTVRQHVGKKVMNEADEEHHVAKVLIAELDEGRKGDHRNAKFTVLAENVRHHIQEEEGDMLPKAKEVDVDFEVLGQRMLARKKQLQADGLSPDTEHTMVTRMKGRTDSSATAARVKRASTLRPSAARSGAHSTRTRARAKR